MEKKNKRGFAAMDPEKQRELARQGGIKAHKDGTAHEWNSETAHKAGKKGGMSVSKNREWMSEIGKRGGKSRAKLKATQDKREDSKQCVGDTERSGASETLQLPGE